MPQASRPKHAMQAGTSPCCYAIRAPDPLTEGCARVAKLCFFVGTVSPRFMTTAAMAVAAILLICVLALCWLPGFLVPGFLSPEKFCLQIFGYSFTSCALAHQGHFRNQFSERSGADSYNHWNHPTGLWPVVAVGVTVERHSVWTSSSAWNSEAL